MKSYSVINKSVIFLFLIIFAFALALALTPGLTAYAASEELVAFESSSVEYDLEGMGFNLVDYPASDTGEVAIFAFMEYGYSEYVNVLDDYNLYFYVYNPRELDFDFESVKNRAQFAVAYDDKGAATDYKKFSLELVKSSDTGLYLKLKVSAGLDTLHSLVVGNDERRYTVSGIELHESGEVNAVEYSVATTFFFSGFAKGYAIDTEAESSLACRTEEIETIELDVKHTTYKVWNTDNVSGQELATVYFNVPERYFDDYGALQQIKAEWLYSITDYIYCAQYADLYNQLSKYLGKEVTREDDLYYYFYSSMEVGSDGYNMYWYDAYNVAGNSINSHVMSRITTIKWLMNKWDNSPEELLEFYKANKDKYSLLSYVDSAMTEVVIDAGDTYDLKGLKEDASGWQWLWEFLGFTNTIEKVCPIYVVTDSDVNLSNEEFASTLKVNVNDVDDIRGKHYEAGSRTVLFRFAVNGFETQSLKVSAHSSDNVPSGFKGGSSDYLYRTKLPLYQDFDIIWLGFKKNGSLTIVPAVSNPTTVIGTTKPPLDNSDKDWSGEALLDSLLPDNPGCADLEELLKGLVAALVGLVIVLAVISIISSIKSGKTKNKSRSSKSKKSGSVKPPRI